MFAERSRTPTILGGHLTAVCLGHRPIRVNVSSHPAESAAPLAQGLDDASAELWELEGEGMRILLDEDSPAPDPVENEPERDRPS